jgi:hypothetical protein
MHGFYMTHSAPQPHSLGRVVAGLIPGHILLRKEKGRLGEEMRKDAVRHLDRLLYLGVPVRLRCGVALDARPLRRADGEDQAAGNHQRRPQLRQIDFLPVTGDFHCDIIGEQKAKISTPL